MNTPEGLRSPYEAFQINLQHVFESLPYYQRRQYAGPVDFAQPAQETSLGEYYASQTRELISGLAAGELILGKITLLSGHPSGLTDKLEEAMEVSEALHSLYNTSVRQVAESAAWEDNYREAAEAAMRGSWTVDKGQVASAGVGMYALMRSSGMADKEAMGVQVVVAPGLAMDFDFGYAPSPYLADEGGMVYVALRADNSAM